MRPYNRAVSSCQQHLPGRAVQADGIKEANEFRDVAVDETESAVRWCMRA